MQLRGWTAEHSVVSGRTCGLEVLEFRLRRRKQVCPTKKQLCGVARRALGGFRLDVRAGSFGIQPTPQRKPTITLDSGVESAGVVLASHNITVRPHACMRHREFSGT